MNQPYILDRYFDRVVVISLDRTPEKLERCDFELRAKGLSNDFYHLSATDGKLMEPPKWWPSGNGAFGCWMSHVRAVMDALHTGVESLLVLEDDCTWQDDAVNMIDQFMQAVPDDWGQIYFGGQHRGTNRPEWIEDKPSVMRAGRIHRTHAYAIHRRAMVAFLQHVLAADEFIAAKNASKPEKRHIDHHLEVAHEKKLWATYCPSFWIAGQTDNFSTISGRQQVEKWWHIAWNECFLSMPFVLVRTKLTTEQRKYLHFGFTLDANDDRIDTGVANARDAKDLMRLARIIADEAVQHQKLPAILIQRDEQEEWITSTWRNTIELPSDSRLAELCNFPKSKLFHHKWINPKQEEREPDPMHKSVEAFITRMLTPERVKGARILEVGSYNVNGAVRDMLTKQIGDEDGPTRMQYHGVDIRPQDKYVDQVLPAEKVADEFGEASFDIVISTEMLEHAEHWEASIAAMKKVLRPGGLMLVTARGPGFPVHGFPDDHWRFTAEDFAHIFVGYTTLYLSDDPQQPGVLFAGIKPQRPVITPKFIQPAKPSRVVVEWHSREGHDHRMRQRTDNPVIPTELAVFYHIACMNNWQDVVRSQVAQLNERGLLPKVQAFVLGSVADVDWVQSLGVTVIGQHHSLLEYELPTLEALHEWCLDHQDGAVMYLHTKGVSAPDDSNKPTWRSLMMDELVNNWQSLLTDLSWHDMIGVAWRNSRRYPHFSGNFWMARADWIASLPDPRTYRDAGGPIIATQPWVRMFAEVWIGSRPWHKVRSLVCHDVNLWTGPDVFTQYDRSKAAYAERKLVFNTIMGIAAHSDKVDVLDIGCGDITWWLDHSRDFALPGGISIKGIDIDQRAMQVNKLALGNCFEYEVVDAEEVLRVNTDVVVMMDLLDYQCVGRASQIMLQVIRFMHWSTLIVTTTVNSNGNRSRGHVRNGPKPYDVEAQLVVDGISLEGISVQRHPRHSGGEILVLTRQ